MSQSRSDPPTAFVVLGNPENRRVSLFQSALMKAGLKAATVVSWLDAIRGRLDWNALLGPGTVLRIDSPGENFEVEREMLLAGAEVNDREENSTRVSAGQLGSLIDDHGLIRYPRQWYLGFSVILSRLEQHWRACRPHRRTHAPLDILLMFDKVRCHAHLTQAALPLPRSLGRISTFDELQQRMSALKINRVFVKLAHGSSASGVVAYERTGTRQQAFSSVERVQSDDGQLHLYNSLKVRRYTRIQEIAQVVDALARERVQVEAWIPKASLQDGCFDLRVLVTGGRARHVVVRQSRTPMTNLHLGNRRGNLDELRARMSPEHWDQAMQTCQRTLRQFAGCSHAGIDLLIAAGFSRHAVLEVNAFGDLLPNLLHEGEDTYTAQISEWTRPARTEAVVS